MMEKCQVKKNEILLVIALLIPLIPMAIAQQWWLFSAFMAFYVFFGILEFIAVKTTGKSISQKFWQYSEDNKTGAIVILVFMAIMWTALLIHLGTKIF